MSLSRSRRLVTAGGLSLALVLAAPAAAFAGHADSQLRDRSGADEAGPGQTPDERAGQTQGSRPGARPAAPAASPRPSAATPRGSKDSSGAQTKPQGKAKGNGTGASGSGRAAGGDPRGNNGTIKIDGQPFGDGRGNEPHVGCVFAVDFYGFDAGDTATITFTGHAPTGGGLLHTQRSTISDDPAGGGQDRDASLVFSVPDQLSELLSIPPHPQQGWHVKVAVDVDSAPGGAKQKVFWITCDSPAAVSGSSTEPVTGTETSGAAAPTASPAPAADTATGVLGAATTTDPTNPTSTSLSSKAVAWPSAVAGTTLLAAQGTTTAGAARAGQVAAAGSNPQALPLTGPQSLGLLLALGLGALGAGGLAHRLGRAPARATHAA